jgi:hypothetical protein
MAGGRRPPPRDKPRHIPWDDLQTSGGGFTATARDNSGTFREPRPPRIAAPAGLILACRRSPSEKALRKGKNGVLTLADIG